MKGVFLDKTNISQIVVVSEICQRLGKERFGDRCKNMGNKSSSTIQTLKYCGHSGSMAIPVGRDKTTYLFHGQLISVLVGTVAIGVNVAVFMHMLFITTMKMSVIKGVKRGCCFR